MNTTAPSRDPGIVNRRQHEIKRTILLVEDQEDLRRVLAKIFQARGFDVIEAPTRTSLNAVLHGLQPDVALIDLKLPDADGLEILSTLKQHWPDTECIVLTGHGSLDLAVESVKRGAFHFQMKPHNIGLYDLVEQAVLLKGQRKANPMSIDAAKPSIDGFTPIFHSAAMRAVTCIIERIAPSDVSVLITGESGTGKEVIADLIHARSLRSKGPFLKINCAALPRELIESELFGSVK